MRNITIRAVDAFMNDYNFGSGNTGVVVDKITTMYLHDSPIAKKDANGVISITNAGWQTNTTKERLNGIPGVNISQLNGEWFLNGNSWNGSWIKIN